MHSVEYSNRCLFWSILPVFVCFSRVFPGPWSSSTVTRNRRVGLIILIFSLTGRSRICLLAFAMLLGRNWWNSPISSILYRYRPSLSKDQAMASWCLLSSSQQFRGPAMKRTCSSDQRQSFSLWLGSVLGNICLKLVCSCIWWYSRTSPSDSFSIACFWMVSLVSKASSKCNPRTTHQRWNYSPNPG